MGVKYDEHWPFIFAILERPKDRLPRLINADWLDEIGQSDRAEFIRANNGFCSVDPRRMAELRRRFGVP